MKIENHVTSFELSKRLKELGVNKDSYFCWRKYAANNTYYLSDSPHGDAYPAYLASELGEMIPPGFSIKRCTLVYEIKYVGGERYYSNISPLVEKTLSNLCALLIIYLLENGLIKL